MLIVENYIIQTILVVNVITNILIKIQRQTSKRHKLLQSHKYITYIVSSTDEKNTSTTNIINY